MIGTLSALNSSTSSQSQFVEMCSYSGLSSIAVAILMF